MKLQYTNTTKGKDGKEVIETREITASITINGQTELTR